MMRTDRISSMTLKLWQKWVDMTRSRCHLHFELEGGSIESHIESCIDSSRSTVARIVADLPENFEPRRILEVGASVGFNSLALAERYKGADVHSVEPDAEAVEVAASMATDFGLTYTPVCGFGEMLNYPDKYFDLIVCHTVIEHVKDVKAVIAEMARVLSDDGIIHIEAPNYIWPYEPHLGVWCIPLLGKPLLRLLSRLQGQAQYNWYIDHLQFVTPFGLEREFRENGLNWVNLVEKKLECIISGNVDVKRYKMASRFVVAMDQVGLARVMSFMIIHMGLYPSIMYMLKRR